MPFHLHPSNKYMANRHTFHRRKSKISHQILKSIDMAFCTRSPDDEETLNFLKDYDRNGRLHPPITDQINPYMHNPEKFPSGIFYRDGNAYFYAKYVEERESRSGSGWMPNGRETIRDAGETLGFKERFKYVKNGSVTNWTMTKYFLHEKSSSKNKNVIYVVSND